MINKSAIKLFPSEFVEFSINRITDFLDKLKLQEENKQNTSFIKREPTPLLVFKTLQEKKESIRFSLAQLTKKYPHLLKLEGEITEVIIGIEKSSNALQLLDKYLRIIETENVYLETKHYQMDHDAQDNVLFGQKRKLFFFRWKILKATWI